MKRVRRGGKGGIKEEWGRERNGGRNGCGIEGRNCMEGDEWMKREGK